MFSCLLRAKIILPALLSVLYTLTYAQTGNLIGSVTDAKKEPLIGATVKVDGTALGAATDIDGKYIIKDVPVGKQTLTVTFVGHVQQSVPIEVKEGTNLVTEVKLKDDAMMLSDVVVVGYGTQIKRDISSSISTLKSEDLEGKQVDNFSAAIQGEAAGVQVTTGSGNAGAATSIRIRGTKTLSNQAEPLYIVDGVPIVSFDISDASGRVGYDLSPLSSINPDDIASLEILKDAAATSIYGARGANGVILITTKQGKVGKTKVSVSSTAGVTMAAHKIKMLNASQFLDLYDEAYKNDGHTDAPTFYPNGITRKTAANTDWIKEVLQVGHFTENNLAISGGDSKTNFYFSAGERDEETFIKGNKLQRIGARINVNHTANKYFTFGTNMDFTRTYNKYVPTGASGGLGAAQSNMLPIYPIKDSLGNYFLGGQNPLAQIALINDENVTYRSISNTYFTVNFTKDLSFKNEIGFDIINQMENFYSPTQITGDSAVAEDRRIFYLTYNYTSTLNYKKEINDKHGIEALIGFNPTATKEQFSYIKGVGFPVNTYTQPQGATTIPYATAGTGRQYAFVSFFARFNYKLLGRHLFQASMRIDGSSRFSDEHKFGYFPSLAYGWVITDEKFLQKQKTLSFLKLRASAGLVGNAEFTDDFAYLSSYSGGKNYNGQSGIGPTNTSVNNLGWESTFKADVGLDFAFFNNRLSGVFDFYRENTYNLLVQGSPLTPSSGYTSVTRNLGSLYNQGFELQITSNNLGPKSKLQWKTVLNLGLNRNKITSLGGVERVGGTNYGDNAAIVGQPAGVWLLAEWAGVDPQTGAPMIYDSTGKKVVADATTTVKYRKPVGSPYPKFAGGLTNTFRIKGFEISILLVYSYGNSVYDDGGKRQTGNLAYGWNQTVETLDRWQKPGDNTNVPKLSLLQNYDLNTTRYLFDASYLRLRSLSFAYYLPDKAVAKMKMRNFKLFVTGQNLLTATKYKGWDPETNRDKSGAITQGVTYVSSPQQMSFFGGFSFSF